MEFWHNPRCRKSREALALLHERGVDPEIREYLKSTPGAEEISLLLEKLGLTDPRGLMRTGQSEYKDQGLGNVTDPQALISAMAETPILIERPVFIAGDKAVIGRPPETVLKLI